MPRCYATVDARYYRRYAATMLDAPRDIAAYIVTLRYYASAISIFAKIITP